jgi:D-lactate dehydrogenase (cytochrome)
MPPAIESASDLAGRLAAIVGDAHVTTDEQERRYLSSDFFYWDGAGTAAIAVAPGDTAEVQAIMRALAGTGREVAIRGGGMSTGRSYVPQTHEAVLLDMRRLNRIAEINIADRYLVAETGCTWQQVLDALAPHGLVCDFTIPLSGSVATVGGAMAHNVTGGMKGVLGIEVVRANGDLVRTGAWARAEHGTPYYRDYGPDLTGLFLGDTGAFGIKTAISLHLSNAPAASALASFGFDSEFDLTRAAIALAPLDYLTMRSGFDPHLTRIVRAMTMPDAQNDDAGWTLHLRCDQLNRAAAEAGIEQARGLCLSYGKEISSHIAAAMAGNKLSVRGSLSATGQRWIATNSVFPLSRALDATAAVRDFLDARAADFVRHDVKLASFITCNPYHFQLEPLFWWSDTVSELSLRHIPAEEAERFRAIPENTENRAFIIATRTALRDLFEELGAVHVHTSKFFRYAELLMPGTRRLLADLKTTLDREYLLNPGNLGLKGPHS